MEHALGPHLRFLLGYMDALILPLRRSIYAVYLRHHESAMTKAKLFMTGGSQAVRLPAEFRFEGDEVDIRRDSRRVTWCFPSPWRLGRSISTGCEH